MVFFHRRVVATLCLLMGCQAWSAAPEERRPFEWFPSRPLFYTLLAVPREVRLSGSIFAAQRDAGLDFDGTNLEAEAVIGHRLEVFHDPIGKHLTWGLGFEVAIYARFFLEALERDLMNADYRVGIPFSFRAGGWSARLGVLHISSHLGDDYVKRFAAPVRKVTRDGLELLVARDLAGQGRAYAGGELNLYAAPGIERGALRLGLEWDRGRGQQRPGTQPFVAADVQWLEQSPHWGYALAAGITTAWGITRFYLAAHARYGATPMGQLRRAEEWYAGFSLQMSP